MSKNGKFLSQKAVKKTKRRNGLLIALCIILALVLVGGVSLYYFVDAKLNKITQATVEDLNPDEEEYAGLLGNMDDEEEETTVPATEAETEPVEETTEAPTEPDYGKSGKVINIMLIGQDARDGENSKLADTIMLCTINKETKTLTLSSFLRDTYLKMPDYKGHTCGKNRINVNYALGYLWGGNGGAMEMLNMCVQNNFGIEIDGDVEVGFETFSEAVFALGGVDVEMDEDEANYMTDLAMASQYKKQHRTFEVGTNHLNGREALWYARMRHSSAADSDIKRAARQRALMGQLMDKCKKLSLVELNAIVDQILPMIVTNISTDEMKDYILELLPLLPQLSFDSIQIPVEGSAHGEIIDLPDGPGSVLKPDLEWNKRVLREICEAD